jgi:hypothetical protein
METKNVGLAGLRGWRGSVANAVAAPVARRSSLREDQVRAVVGAVFLLLAVTYVIGVVKDLVTDNA